METRKTLFKLYRRIEQVITPGLKYSQYLYEETLRKYIGPEMKWLDLGCGHQILPIWRTKEEHDLVRNSKMIVGLDYDLDSLKNHNTISMRVRGDMSRLPFEEGTFDLATANMVVEHLQEPEIQFQGVCRVLKSGGLFIIHTPNSRGYGTIAARLIPNPLKRKLVAVLQGRKAEDIFDTYYRANTAKAIAELAEKSGFEVVKIRMIVSSAILAVIPFLAMIELVWIRFLMTDAAKPWRTNMIAVLRKR